MSKVILLNKRPAGKPVLEDFKFVEEENPVAGAGQVLLKTRYVSVDPYLRGRMGIAKSYIAPFELNKPIGSDLISEVIESGHPDFVVGDFVLGQLEWREYQLSSGQDLTKIDEKVADLSAYLGILGMTGHTAFMGLIEFGKPQPGETLLISVPQAPWEV